MTPELVEKVARAIYSHEFSKAPGKPELDGDIPSVQEHFREEARIVIPIIESALLREMANELEELDADAAWQTWLNAFARERGLLEGE